MPSAVETPTMNARKPYARPVAQRTAGRAVTEPMRRGHGDRLVLRQPERQRSQAGTLGWVLAVMALLVLGGVLIGGGAAAFGIVVGWVTMGLGFLVWKDIEAEWRSWMR